MLEYFHKKSKGFTLIELLVVIAIIGILSTIVLVSLNTAREKARDSRRLGDLRQVALALEMHYDDIGSYPIYEPCTGGSPSSWESMAGDISSYMAAVPDDPDPGQNYAYSSDSSGSEYVLRAVLEATPTIDDLEGDQLSCTAGTNSSCDDPAYCIRP
jgi:type II secretion system protein G